eukprot:Clim_evm8s13 gene=Clim_evmTU8s13
MSSAGSNHGDDAPAVMREIIDSRQFGGSNTGPKGVLTDAKLAQWKEQRNAAAYEQQKIDYVKATAVNIRDDNNDDLDELDLEDDDDFMIQYMEKRRAEMADAAAKAHALQKVGPEQYLQRVEEDKTGNPIVVHLYEEELELCQRMNEILNEIAKKKQHVQFLALEAHAASDTFKGTDDLPTLLVYQRGELIGNIVRVVDLIGPNFDTKEVLALLAEANVLPHDATARREFVTSGGLQRIQEIQAEPGSQLRDYIDTINRCYPEEIVRYYSPGYSSTLLEKIDQYSPAVPAQ